MPKEIQRVLFIGDTHIGQDFSPTRKGEYKNKRQEWISETLQAVIERAKKEARRKRFGVNLGGDLVHLPHSDKHRELAEILLRPLTSCADDVRGVYGTEYHVGSNDAGSDDRAIYRKLDAVAYQDWMYLDYGGLILDWAHHGMSVSKRVTTELNGMRSKAEDAYLRALQYGEKPPSVIIRHHVHYCPMHSPVWHRDIWSGVAPAMCLADAYAGKVAAGMPPTVGALWWDVEANNFERWVYPVPKEIWYAK